MTVAAVWPRRVTAALLAALLPLLGALTIIAAGPPGETAGEIVTAGHIDAIAPTRVVPVRQAEVPPQLPDRIVPAAAVVDSGPPRRAELPEVPAPRAPAGSGVNAVPAHVPDYRGPPPGSAP